MNCEQTQAYIATLGSVTGSIHSAAIQAHVDTCPVCRAQLGKAREIQRLLEQEQHSASDMQNSPPSPSALRTLRRTLSSLDEHQRQRRRHVTSIGIAATAGFALAASLFMALLVTDVLDIPGDKPLQPAAGVRMALNDTHMLRLSFDSPENVDVATISIILPDHVRIAGYENSSRIEWDTKLKAGRNTLKLPLVASRHGTGTLRSELRIAGRSKTFSVLVDVELPRVDSSALSHIDT